MSISKIIEIIFRGLGNVEYDIPRGCLEVEYDNIIPVVPHLRNLTQYATYNKAL